LRFFLDNNLAPRVAKAINALLDEPHEAHHLRDGFSADVSDVEWIIRILFISCARSSGFCRATGFARG
jgi:predicted nuclease of predicted toxin-antitoxin system